MTCADFNGAILSECTEVGVKIVPELLQCLQISRLLIDESENLKPGFVSVFAQTHRKWRTHELRNLISCLLLKQRHVHTPCLKTQIVFCVLQLSVNHV
jgi:hypothetical protein